MRARDSANAAMDNPKIQSPSVLVDGRSGRLMQDRSGASAWELKQCVAADPDFLVDCLSSHCPADHRRSVLDDINSRLRVYPHRDTAPRLCGAICKTGIGPTTPDRHTVTFANAETVAAQRSRLGEVHVEVTGGSLSCYEGARARSQKQQKEASRRAAPDARDASLPAAAQRLSPRLLYPHQEERPGTSSG